MSSGTANALGTAASRPDAPPWWLAAGCGAMAGGMGWGIRGQYGHETGAMIAGVLVSLVLAMLFCRGASATATARAVAFGTIAMGFGGSMTYGQTIGLTQNASVIGNWAALEWGMLGLAIKGGLWIGFAGVFLGMGLGGQRYRGRHLLVIMTVAIAAYLLGRYLLNEPYDPANKVLPRIYFSADWRWEPRGGDLKPRREVWGGILFALIAVTALVSWWRSDKLAWRLGAWGVLGGAIGFPLGQCLQAWHAWNPLYFRAGFLAEMAPVINWWNMMETTFGMVMGTALGFGLWIHRKRVAPAEDDGDPTLSGLAEWIWLVPFLGILIAVEFASIGWIDQFFDLGLAGGFLPLVLVAATRSWSFLVVLPITLLPIAGKTFREFCVEQTLIPTWTGVLVLLLIPLATACYLARLSVIRASAGEVGARFARRNLLFVVWLYFLLNFAFFRFPWPWQPWTARTPNALIFLACALGLTLVAWMWRVNLADRHTHPAS